ncbi:hypothetical protein Vafri_19130, partial [Volvox africanus]
TALAGAGGGNGVAGGGSPTGSGGAAAFTIVTASSPPGSGSDLVSISRTIKVEREMPNAILQALLRVLSWRPYEFLQGLSRQSRRASTATAIGSGLPLLLLPGGIGTIAAGGSTAAAMTGVGGESAEVQTDASVFDSAATDVEFSSSTNSLDETSTDGDDAVLLWDPALIGALTLVAAAASVAVLVTIASTS